MKKFITLILSALALVLPIYATSYENLEWLEPKFAECDFAIAVLPDIQNMTRYYPDVLDNMFDWLRDSAKERKLAFVIQLGDLTDANVTTEWMRVRDNFAKLDGILPYGFVPGNHDYYDSDTLSRNASFFNIYLPYSKHSQALSFGGAYEEGKMDSSYHYFAAGGIDYMVLCLEDLPRDPVVEWANKVVADNPNRRIIVATHTYMLPDGEYISTDGYDIDGNAGKELWENLVSLHDNIILVLCGHMHSDDLVVRTDTGEGGNKVHQLLVDIQDMDYYQGGMGMVALLGFKNNGNDVAVNWYSTKENALFKQKNQFLFSLDSGLILPLDFGEKPDKAEPPKGAEGFGGLMPILLALAGVAVLEIVVIGVILARKRGKKKV